MNGGKDEQRLILIMIYIALCSIYISYICIYVFRFAWVFIDEEKHEDKESKETNRLRI